VRNYILRRLLVNVISLIGVSIIIFMSIRLVPGDVVEVMLAQQGNMGKEQVEQLRQLFGLDRPLHVQYLDWFADVVRGDLGHSLRTGRAILPDILLRAPVTVELSILSAVFAVVVSIPAGVVAAVRRDSILSLLAQVGSLVGLSVPAFWLGAMAILVSSRYLGFYGGGTYVSPFDDVAANLRMFALPSATVGLSLSAALTRYTRSAMLEILSQDFVRTARSKGLNERRVVFGHAFRNALIPVITVMGLQLGFLLGGVVVTETVFALPGMGRLVVDAINQRDYPMVQAVVLIITAMVMAASLVVDIIYAYVDPRVRYK
jgi:peptide/nickel transport system permease protein